MLVCRAGSAPYLLYVNTEIALERPEYIVDTGRTFINHTRFAGGARHGMTWHGQNAHHHENYRTPRAERP